MFQLCDQSITLYVGLLSLRQRDPGYEGICTSNEYGALIKYLVLQFLDIITQVCRTLSMTGKRFSLLHALVPHLP